MATVTTDPLVGRLVDGRYEVVSRIARGGMATVYLAVDRRLDRDVALKIMHPHLAEGSGGADFVSRFRREARSAARLTHPGLVAVFDQGHDGDMSYLTMEYVSGSNLRRVLQTSGTLTLGQTLDVLDEILDALAAAHRAGLVHRDMKPENVLLDTEGRLKVTDFGLARAVNEVTAATTGTVLGTIAYLSPELISTGGCDARTDVYAVGILAYEMITGAVPHGGTNPIQVAYHHVNTDVPPPSDVAPWLPAEVDELVCALTARNPADRPLDASAALALVRSVRAALSDDDLAQRVEPPPPPPTADAAAPPPPPGESPTAVLTALKHDDLEAAGLTARIDLGEVARPTPNAETVSLTRPWHGRRRLWWPVAVVVLLAAVGAGAVWWFDSGPGAYVKVPAGLEGVAQAEAEAILDRANLEHTSEQGYHDTVAPGLVVTTDPGPGRSVRKDGTVRIVVSRGVEMLTVPNDLVGAAQLDATTSLQGEGFELTEPLDKASDSVPAGQVLAVSGPDGPLDGGAEVRHDTPVTLTVSSGPAPVVIPQVVGLTKEDALATLDADALKVTVEEQNSEEVEAGRVIRQDPKEGTKGHRRDAITIVVSLGPPPVDLPNTYSLNVREATKRLEDAGFKVEVRHPQGISPLNIVYAQSPEGGRGKTAPKGSTVVINVF